METKISTHLLKIFKLTIDPLPDEKIFDEAKLLKIATRFVSDKTENNFLKIDDFSL